MTDTPVASARLMDMAAGLTAATQTGEWPTNAVGRVRDLVLLDAGSVELVVACDSNAALGDKPHDAVTQDQSVTGYSVTKVCLMEVLAAGAVPIVLVNNLCCEMHPTGEKIRAGIDRALSELAVRPVVTGSDETNMPTVQTGVGTTVIGVAVSRQLRLGKSLAGDAVYCVGVPKDGLSVPYEEGDDDVASIRHLRAVVDSDAAHEVLPVGSHGIRHEIDELAKTSGLVARHAEPPPVDVTSSAGASTCFLVSAAAGRADELRQAALLPVTRVAELESPA